MYHTTVRPKCGRAVCTSRHKPQPTVCAAPAATNKKVYTVTLVLPNGRQAVIRAGTGASIYDVARYAGVGLPASCLQGSCTACCGKVVSGSVKQPGQSCLPPPLVKEGYVTLCCAVPQSDATIQTHQGAAVRKWKAQQGLK